MVSAGCNVFPLKRLRSSDQILSCSTQRLFASLRTGAASARSDRACSMMARTSRMPRQHYSRTWLLSIVTINQTGWISLKLGRKASRVHDRMRCVRNCNAYGHDSTLYVRDCTVCGYELTMYVRDCNVCGNELALYVRDFNTCGNKHLLCIRYFIPCGYDRTACLRDRPTTSRVRNVLYLVNRLAY